MNIKRFPFETRILAAIIISVIAVVAIGMFAYKTMTGIVSSISEEAKPDVKLALLKEILSDLSDAESSVKSYSITNNSDYLYPFYVSASSIDSKVRKLNIFSINDAEQQPVIDSISKLIDQKFFILKELILTQHDDRVAATLKKLSKKIDDAQKRNELATKYYQTHTAQLKKELKEIAIKQKKEEEDKEGKKNTSFFSRLFGKKKKKKEEAAEVTNILPPPVTNPFDVNAPVKEVQKEIVRIKKQEARFTQVFREEQLDLTKKDKIVMDKIRALILRLEDKEQKDIIIKTVEADDMATKANRLIGAFCVVISILLFILGYTIIRYTRKIRAYNKALNEAKIEAENLAQAKETFLANMSHEIRTPMNAVVGFTEQVLKSPLAPKQKEQVEIIKKSSDHLLNIINEILDLSKLGAGKINIERVAFHPKEVIEDVVKLFQHQASEKNLNLYFAEKGSIPNVLLGDEVRLKQVLVNLTGNALKFTDNGEVKIEVEAHKSSEKNIILKIAVSDTGIGIPKEKISSIFNEFEQVSNNTSKKYGGTGLGLSISKKLVELQGGHIHIKSEESKGTTIIFTIPFAEGVDSDIVSNKEIEIDKTALKGKSILIADDGEYNRKLVANILDNWDVSHSEAINGRQAIELLSANHYDLILMDMLMPEMSGIEATVYIRKKLTGKKAKIPIIGLTAAASDSVALQCKKAGMNDFLSKPFKEYQLFAKLTSTLNPEILNNKPSFIDNNEFNLIEPTLKNSKPTLISSPYNLDELKKVSNGDPKFVSEMISVFVRTTNEGIQTLKNSSKNEEWDAVADMAHHIAPPFRHIDALSILQIIKQIETSARSRTSIEEIPLLIESLEKEAQKLITLLEKEAIKTIT